MVICAFESNIGKKRSANQDCCDAFCLKDAAFALVADGMGGHKGGSVASQIAVETTRSMLEKEYEPSMSDAKLSELLICCCRQSNAKIYERSLSDDSLNGMGTTMVLAAVRKNRAIVLNVGDSRAYLISEEKTEQITKDQSYVQYLIDNGKISEQEAKTHPQKNVIMQAVGTEASVLPDIYEISYKDESLLLCSDGLSNKITADDIKDVINLKDSDAKTKVKKLIDMANAAGGEDNISVVLLMKD